MRWIGKLALIVGVMCIASGTALAQQTKLKWAHVYETSEPYHKWSVWAAAEIEKRTGSANFLLRKQGLQRKRNGRGTAQRN